MAVNTLEEKFLGQLPFVYFSEKQFVDGQAKMAAMATDPALKAGIEKHMQETKQHVVTLENVFLAMNHKPEEKKCPICMGLLASTDSSMKEAGNSAIRDVTIGGEAMLIENYEIAAYKGLIGQATALGRQDVVQLLQQNLQQEENTFGQLEQSAPMLTQKAASAS